MSPSTAYGTFCLMVWWGGPWSHHSCRYLPPEKTIGVPRGQGIADTKRKPHWERWHMPRFSRRGLAALLLAPIFRSLQLNGQPAASSRTTSRTYRADAVIRSEEHTSELQSLRHLV